MPIPMLFSTYVSLFIPGRVSKYTVMVLCHAGYDRDLMR